MPAPPDAKQEVFNLELGEGRAEGGGGLPDGRVEDPRGETALGRFDGDVEIKILMSPIASSLPSKVAAGTGPSTLLF